MCHLKDKLGELVFACKCIAHPCILRLLHHATCISRRLQVGEDGAKSYLTASSSATACVVLKCTVLVADLRLDTIHDHLDVVITSTTRVHHGAYSLSGLGDLVLHASFSIGLQPNKYIGSIVHR